MESQVILRIRFVENSAEVEKALAILRRGTIRALGEALRSLPREVGDVGTAEDIHGSRATLEQPEDRQPSVQARPAQPNAKGP